MYERFKLFADKVVTSLRGQSAATIATGSRRPVHVNIVNHGGDFDVRDNVILSRLS